jgi:hypothetical protein
MKRLLRREDAQRDPNLIWNQFINFLAISEIDQLDSTQRPAYLTFRYDSEVQNGGHLQFFVNRPTQLTSETIRALRQIGAMEQAALLRSAFERWVGKDRETPRTVDEFVEAARQVEFEDVDSRYCGVSPSVTQLLEKYLETHRDSFFELAG